MDVLDQLQSGLFFHPPPNPTLSFPQHYVSYPALPAAKRIDIPLSGQPKDDFSSTYSLPSREVSLPLLSVLVDVDINGRHCTTKVTQKFSNASSSIPQNVKYIFPVYDGSVVTSFRCWIGNDKLIEGAVKVKEAARADFKHAVSQRKVAVLVEETAPEVFETNVGNIPEHTTVKIEITYASILKVDNSTGGLVLTIPTSIAPRYGTAPAGYSSNQPFLTEGLRINVQVSMPTIIRKIESRSHPVSVEMGAVSHKSFKDFATDATSDTVDFSKGRATLSDRQTALHRDFVLQILSSSCKSLRSQAIAATQPGLPHFTTIAVTIHPNDLFQQSVNMGDFAGEIIFMADRSGSMQSKMPSLINVMNIFLRSLPETCSFNIASFGDKTTWLWPSSESYSQTTLNVASQHIDEFQANYGGTEIYGALYSILDHYDKRNNIPTSVILLTDGEVWNVDNVIELVRSIVSDCDSNIRFFSLGIGDQVSHRLVEGIGEQGGGYAEVVPESLMSSWQERVIQMLKAALSPSHLRCTVDLGEDLVNAPERQIAGHQVQCPGWVQAPHHIPILNTFSHFSLYCIIYEGLDSLPKTINITATTDKNEKLTAQLPLEMVSRQTAIHHLAAKALMKDFETGQSWLHSLNSTLKSTSPTIFEKVLEQEAQNIGQMWSIPSKWTSYVAIDRTTAEHHAISIRKADAIKAPRLMQLRNYPNGVNRAVTSGRRMAGHYRGGAFSGQGGWSASDRKCFLYGSSPRRAEGYQLCSPRIMQHSIETLDPTISALETILHTQEADGKFNLSDCEPLWQKYDSKTLDDYLEPIFNRTPLAMRYLVADLKRNITAIVHITHVYPASKALWELQVLKAREWSKRAIRELLTAIDPAVKMPGISLEKLEKLIIEQLR